MTMRKIYRPSLWFQLCLASVVGILVYNAFTYAEDAEDWMPDPHLQHAIREALEIPDGIPIHPADIAELSHLHLITEHDIQRLKGLEHAVNLRVLFVIRTEVSDLTPLAGLENLQLLKLNDNRITDISPLSGLLNLQHLELHNNQIVDISPLAGLIGLRDLRMKSNEVVDISPLSGLVNLQCLKLHDNQISDLTPLVGLIGLQELRLGSSLISDLTPLANLQNLRVLSLQGEQISDVSPLAGLVGLQELILENNAISDFTPLVSLTNLKTFVIYPNPIPLGNQFIGIDASHLQAAEENFICEHPRPSYTVPVAERLNNRDYPSVFLTHKRSNYEEDPDPFNQLVHYDFSFMFEPFHPLVHPRTFNSPFGGAVRTGSHETIAHLSHVHREAIRENPNMIFIVEIPYFDGRFFNLPEDSPYWFRNPDGSIARRLWKVDRLGNEYWEPLLNFTHPDVIEIIIQQTVAIAKCGLYDGIWLDRWKELEGDFRGELSHLVTKEDELNARLQILQGIREAVSDDFLIMVNSKAELPQSAPYINGVFIEAGAPKSIYTHKALYHFENIIKWYESNLREPAFTLLWGAVDHKPPTSQRTVRQFTTLSLTHSDGYVNVSSGTPDGRSLWYDFWDAPLGRPIGGDETKAQLYEDREGLFIREFTNGWAVYNRSGKEQEIELPQAVSSWSSGVEHQRRHTLADLDGEIYLKAELLPTVDVNRDGIVNIQDLVIVANALGEAEPDLNGDGVVNIQDLVIVANAF